MKRLLSLTLIIVISLSLFNCQKQEAPRNEKLVEYCEIGMLLSPEFELYDHGGTFNEAYSDGKIIVGFSRYSFLNCVEYGFLDTYTPMKFAQVYLSKFGREVEGGVQVHGDVPYFAYTAEHSDGSSYFYMPTFYCTPYAYFVITFITPASRQVDGRAEFLYYASTVHILEKYI